MICDVYAYTLFVCKIGAAAWPRASWCQGTRWEGTRGARAAGSPSWAHKSFVTKLHLAQAINPWKNRLALFHWVAEGRTEEMLKFSISLALLLLISPGLVYLWDLGGICLICLVSLLSWFSDAGEMGVLEMVRS